MLCPTNSAALAALANTDFVTVVDSAALDASNSIRVGSNVWAVAIAKP